ncbi:response regulator [Photobacterium galatheae]|uniref:response regulator n=1 Tax=Photobacterium galatheae TaxID=1654360 RepID=UPI00202CF61C|nr:response regulator [Photobacterium galatheae]MCM0147191.1 response regulator [Photobacterium galatheae]
MLNHKKSRVLNILIIEDEPAIADTLIHVLELDGYQVSWFPTAGEGLAYLKGHQPELLVLDVGLPDGNGFELCKTIREFSDIPIIFLTARNDEIDRVVGLEIGADDYVTKPFSPREMLARIKLRIKNRPPVDLVSPQASVPGSAPEAETEALFANNFDFYCQSQPLGLTAVEFKILDKLVQGAPRVFSREQLMVAADMAPEAVYERNIDSHIKAIRQKLKAVGLTERIQTKRGFGYFYSDREDA